MKNNEPPHPTDCLTLLLRFFEMDAQFPKDYMLTIQVWDYDATSADDLIGETSIDIENRFYSTHRAHCGIAKTYNTTGCNAWRDREKPTQILEYLCKKNNLPAPEYRDSCVTIGKQRFPFDAVMGSYSDEGLLIFLYLIFFLSQDIATISLSSAARTLSASQGYWKN